MFVYPLGLWTGCWDLRSTPRRRLRRHPRARTRLPIEEDGHVGERRRSAEENGEGETGFEKGAP